MTKKILLVEDDLILGETTEELLLDEKFEVVWVKDGQEALNSTFIQEFDIFLLDVNIPFINGFELLKELRDSGDKTPSIYITANIDTQSLKKGFEVGADDYIKKPFDFDELLIRIENALKKSFKSYDTIVSYDNLKYNVEEQALYLDEKLIHLSPSEENLVKYFLKNIGKILSKDELIFQTNRDSDGSDSVLRVQISKLKKIGFKITNVRSIGYKLEKL
ncbi:MAG: response regulator transcription factor [Campylobacterota bacterium]|nr:response regulator transcription factor [Campylobacterota bacterium]